MRDVVANATASSTALAISNENTATLVSGVCSIQLAELLHQRRVLASQVLLELVDLPGELVTVQPSASLTQRQSCLTGAMVVGTVPLWCQLVWAVSIHRYFSNPSRISTVAS